MSSIHGIIGMLFVRQSLAREIGNHFPCLSTRIELFLSRFIAVINITAYFSDIAFIDCCDIPSVFECEYQESII